MARLTRAQLRAIFAKSRREKEAQPQADRRRITEGRVPPIIRRVGFDFDWDEKKLWKLDVPTTKMSIGKLTWHFDIPFLTHRGKDYNLKPSRLLSRPEVNSAEHKRMMDADIRHPIDVMENKGRWLILDGLHRLMKLYNRGDKSVRVRIIPRERIPEILED